MHGLMAELPILESQDESQVDQHGLDVPSPVVSTGHPVVLPSARPLLRHASTATTALDPESDPDDVVVVPDDDVGVEESHGGLSPGLAGVEESHGGLSPGLAGELSGALYLELVGESDMEDRMNGSMMPTTDFESEGRQPVQVRRPPRFAVPDVLAMTGATIRSPGAWPPPGDGFAAVAGMMHSIVTSGGDGLGEGLGDRSIDFFIVDGDAYNHCCRFINSLTGSFYVGITENVVRRYDEHIESSLCGPAPIMVVLVQADSSATTAALERQLLAAYLYSPCCMNVGRGGERASGGSPHYLYVLKSTTPLLRRSTPYPDPLIRRRGRVG